MSQTISGRRNDALAAAADDRSTPVPSGAAASHGDGSQAALRLAERAAEEMAERWSRGERPTCEEYLAGEPLLAGHPEAVMELVYEEVCQRQRRGEIIREDEWCARFPQRREQLLVLFDCHRLLDGGGEPAFPNAGESFGELRLLSELGRGAQGRVYLAIQPSLADRPVVIKLTALAGEEHRALARLQHTYIVPLYWSQDYPVLRLRALCMPFFGGATLAQLIVKLGPIPPAKRRGSDLWHALVEAAAELPLGPTVDGPFARRLARASYVEAVCHLVACLAEALEDAHQREVLHLDIKPSNVLLAADGQPMLLDFHLAQRPIEPGSNTCQWLGGTPGYMPPEQQVAMQAIRDNRDIAQRIDGRADVYSLAMLACEALGGELPPEGASIARWLRRANSGVSVALADLLAKCLEHDAARRYPSAGALAADLRRQLAHRPLKHTANRSLPERWSKWRRRRPYALTAMIAFAAFAIWAVVAGSNLRQRLNGAEAALAEADHHLESADYSLASAAIDRGLLLASGLPWQSDLVLRFRQAQRVASAGQAADELQTLVERLRGLYGADGAPVADARAIEEQTERLWHRRRTIINALAGSPARRSLRTLENSLLELALLWTDAHVTAATGEKRPAARQEALEVLAQAEELVGPRLVLYLAQARLAREAGDETTANAADRAAASLSPRSAGEHRELGRMLLRDGQATAAARHFAIAVDLEPGDLWSNFYQAQADYELGHYDDAVMALTACIALAPRSGWCYYNRGLSYARLGRIDRAQADLSRALALSPALGVAALRSGALNHEAGRHQAAIADFKRALSAGADPIECHYYLALAYASLGDAAQARESLEHVLQHDASHAGALDLMRQLDPTTPPVD